MYFIGAELPNFKYWLTNKQQNQLCWSSVSIKPHGGEGLQMWGTKHFTHFQIGKLIRSKELRQDNNPIMYLNNHTENNVGSNFQSFLSNGKGMWNICKEWKRWAAYKPAWTVEEVGQTVAGTQTVSELCCTPGCFETQTAIRTAIIKSMQSQTQSKSFIIDFLILWKLSEQTKWKN